MELITTLWIIHDQSKPKLKPKQDLKIRHIWAAKSITNLIENYIISPFLCLENWRQALLELGEKQDFKAW